jgi:hypothetical protein
MGMKPSWRQCASPHNAWLTFSVIAGMPRYNGTILKSSMNLIKYVIQVAEEFGVGLVTTADSHYPNPDAWKDRELYKRLGWLGKGRPSWAEEESQLPEGVEEIGYELYPKNGDQIWESYKQYSNPRGLSMMMM